MGEMKTPKSHMLLQEPPHGRATPMDKLLSLILFTIFSPSLQIPPNSHFVFTSFFLFTLSPSLSFARLALTQLISAEISKSVSTQKVS